MIQVLRGDILRVMGSAILLWILLLSSQNPITPAQSPGAILDRARLDIRRSEPSWEFGRPVCNFPPLITEQEDFSCGIWQVGTDPRAGFAATVTVHQIINSEAVLRWMAGVPTRSTADWVVVPYDLGAPAYFSTHQKSPALEITFGKARFIVIVNGTSKVDVDRVARSLLRQIAD